MLLTSALLVLMLFEDSDGNSRPRGWARGWARQGMRMRTRTRRRRRPGSLLVLMMPILPSIKKYS